MPRGFFQLFVQVPEHHTQSRYRTENAQDPGQNQEAQKKDVQRASRHRQIPPTGRQSLDCNCGVCESVRQAFVLAGQDFDFESCVR
jgi:hypothetical protein